MADAGGSSSIKTTPASEATATNAATASVAAEAPAADGELVGRRSETSRTYVDPDGGFRTVLSPDPVNFRVGSTWEKIDTHLVAGSWLKGAARTTAAAVTATLPATLEAPIEVAGEGGTIAAELRGAVGTRVLKGSTATWAEALPGVDVAVTALPDGIKETLTLAGPTSPSQFVYDLALPAGSTPVLGPDGTVRLEKADGQVLGLLPKPFMDDASNRSGRPGHRGHSEAVAYSLEQGDAGWTVTMTADRAWLQAPDRAWPVVIDPTITLGTGGTTSNLSVPIADGLLASTNLNSWQVHPVGSDAAGTYRTLLQFPQVTTQVPTDAIIEKAKLMVQTAPADVAGVDQTVQLRGLTETFTASQVTWLRRDATSWTTAGGSMDGSASDSRTFPVAGGEVSFYPTKLVQDWVSGTRPNNGMALRAASETGGQVNNIYGSNASGGQPQLEVRWFPRLGAAKGDQFFDKELTDRLGLRVNLSTGNLLLSAGDGTIAAPSLPVQVARSYNGLGAGLGGQVGYGWRLDVGRATGKVLSNDGRFAYIAADGRQYTFWPKSGGGFVSPPELGADVAATAGSTHTMTFRQTGTQMIFRDGDGLVTAMTDRNGNSQTFSYSTTVSTADGLPYLHSVTDPVGRVFTVTRGFFISKVADPTGRGTTYSYTGDYLTSSTDPNGKTTSYGYDSSNRINSITTPEGRTTKIGYNSDNRVTSVTQVLVRSTSPLTTQDITTTFAYTRPTAPGGSGSTAVTDPRSMTTTYTWDVRNRVTKAVDPLGHNRSVTYGPDDSVTSAVDALGSGTTAGNTTTYGFDSDHRSTGSTAPTGAQTVASYLEAPGTVTSRVAHWQPNSTTDAEDNKATYTYDGPGNVTKVQDTTTSTPGTSRDFTYNPPAPAALVCGGKPGQVCTASDGIGTPTAYTYDTLGQLITTDHPSPLPNATATYDNKGRVATSTDGKGTVRTFTYDETDHVTQVRYDGVTGTCTSTVINAGSCLTLSYDGDGNQLSMTDQHGGSSWSYDTLGRETSRTEPGSGTSSLTYDAAGNVLTATDGSGTITYGYDAANQLTSLAEPGATCPATGSATGCTRFDYNANGLRTKTTYPTTPGTTVEVTPDNSGRISRIKGLTGSTTDIDVDLSYTYIRGTATDGMLTRTRTDNTASGTPRTTYSYDTLGQLTQAQEMPATGSTPTALWTYGYDPAGNRTSAKLTPGPTDPATTFGYNDANQLISRNGSTTGFTYDNNGAETAAVGVSTRTNGAWNAKQQLTSTTIASTTTAFSYTGEGNKRRLSAGDRTFRNTALGVTARTVNGSTTTSFVRDPSGTLVAMRVGGASYYYLFDNLGSVVGLVNTTGQRINSYTYDPYGQNRSRTEAVPNPYQYTGEYIDSQSGMTKLGIRYYDPTLGRFTQPDPTEQDPHYTYAGNNPCNFVDVSGANRCAIAGGSGGLAGLLGGAAAGFVVGGPVGAAVGGAVGAGAVGGFVGGACSSTRRTPGGRAADGAIGGVIGGSFGGLGAAYQSLFS